MFVFSRKTKVSHSSHFRPLFVREKGNFMFGVDFSMLICELELSLIMHFTRRIFNEDKQSTLLTNY